MKVLIFICTITISLKGSITQDVDLEALIENTFNVTLTDGVSSTSPTYPTDDTSSTDNNDNIDDGYCECVPYYLCSENRTMIENGENLIDIRIKTGCDNYLDVCCKTGETLKQNETITTPTSQPINATSSSCGQRNSDGISLLRIMGAFDNEAQFAEFPWMVAITTRQLPEGSSTPVSVYHCGGSLLSPSVVLTAAHCVRNKTGLSVRAGEWDTQTKNEPLPIQVSAVREVVIHEQFSPLTLHNDVALLILETPLELAPNVGTICLPAQGEDMDGRQCVASGWGKNVFGREGQYQVILKKVELPTVPRDKCLQYLQQTRLGSKFTLHESFICAGGIRGQDTCKGDGGSPLACPSSTNPQVYVQAGIVAWGVGCGTETPAVYVNVPYFRNWIDEKLSIYNIDVRIKLD